MVLDRVGSGEQIRSFGAPPFVRLLTCLLLYSCLLLAAKRAVTLDDVLTRTSSSALRPVWSPDGSSFLYQQGSAVYRYTVSDRKAKSWFELGPLESAARKPAGSDAFSWQNRRVATHQFQWFPNGKDLLATVAGDIFVVHSSGDFEPVTATDVAEEDPELSPDGRLILYRLRQNLFVLDVETKQSRQLTVDGSATILNGQLDWVYPEELGLATASWWSPDSKSIAYLQFDIADEFIYPQTHLLPRRALAEPQRYPQAGTPNARVRLGVAPAAGGATTWMQVGNQPDVLLARVAWLPDASAVAVEALPRLQNALDLLFCSPLDGSARTVVHEESRDWINVADNLWFLKSRPEFLWTSERGGFRHIYRYKISGELLAQMTTGNWQVSSVTAIDEKKGFVYYTSSEASPLETQLYRITLNGGPPTQLTKSGSDHTIESNPDGTCFVDSFSSLTRAPESVLDDSAGGKLAVLTPEDKKSFRDVSLQSPEIVDIKASDGTVLYARLIKPLGFNARQKYPAIVHVYGGPGAQIVRNRWDGVDWDQLLAARGYVVWQLDNRGSTGRGHAFESPVYRQLGQQEVADQRLGVERLLQMGFVDPRRIGITGWSYGGFMTVHAMLSAADLFKVGVAGAPVTDWRNYDTIYTERYMGLPEQNAAGYQTSSNVENASKLTGRLLIVHNIEDDNVLFQNTVQMANAFDEAGRQYYLQIYPQRSHEVTGAAQKTLYTAMTDFFDQNLK